MQIKNQFAKHFAKIGQSANRAEFEVRFNQVQRGLLKQLNEKKAKIVDNGVEHDVARLQKERDKLFDRAQRLRDLQTDMKTNALRFLDIRDAAQKAVNAADEDENATLSADEVTALNKSIASIAEDVAKLKFTTASPEFTDGNLANRLRQEVATLQGLTAVEGTIDAEGSGSPSNDNRSILDTLESIVSRAENYAESATVLVGGLNQVIVDTDKQAYALEADLAELTAVEVAKQKDAIADLDIRYGNLIRSISLAFEVQSGLGDMLAAGTQFEAPKGSILNIFT